VRSIDATFVTTMRALVREVMPTILQAVSAEARPPSLKPDGSFVTEIDTAVERHLSDGLGRLLPNVPILGEETATDGEHVRTESALEVYTAFLRAPSQIVIDPIDGTKNFVEGGKPFCIAAALAHAVNDGSWPAASVVALPMSDVMFWTEGDEVRREEIGSGAIEVVRRRAVAEGRMSVNSSDRGWLANNGFVMKLPWISSGSSVHDFMGTAVGDLRGSMVGKQRLWDLMAPLAIAERLGCTLRDLTSGEALSCIRPSDLSPNFVDRPWGIERKMVLAPRDTEVNSLIAKL